MALIESRAAIHAPIDLVYRISQDYSVRYEWDPFPENIAVISGPQQTLAVGTQVQVQSKLGMHMVVEFVQVQAPGVTAVKMVQGPWFLAKFAGSWIFKATATNETTATFKYSIVAKPTWLRFLIEPLAYVYFSRVVTKRLAGLKAYCERQAG